MLRLLTFGGLALEGDDPSVAPRLRPPRLALLAVLAAAGERGSTRERLTGLFWPEADDEHGRHSLRQALYALRNELGEDPVLTGSSLSLNPRVLESDLAQFRAALLAGDRSRAAALYRGPFLEGFYLPGLPEFERWVEQERTRLAQAVTAALQTLAGEATGAGDHESASRWWHQLTQLDPLSGRAAVGYIRALAAGGDRPKALAFIRAHESLIRRELEAEPDPDIRQLEAELRGASAAGSKSAAGQPRSEPVRAEPVEVPPEPAPAVSPEPARSRSKPGLRAAGLTLALIALIAVIMTGRGLSRTPGRPASTTSAVAQRFYEEGLRAYYGSDLPSATRLMEAALREDSSFALPAYYLALMAPGHAPDERQRALRLARRAPEPERLMIEADLFQKQHDPRAVRAAENWAAKYPDEPRAFAVLGSALAFAGEWSRAVSALERAIALDLRAEPSPGDDCRVCDDYGRLTEVYFWWDSLPAAERTTRRNLAANPGHVTSWLWLALAAARTGDSTLALEHLGRLHAATATRADQSHGLRVRLLLEQYDVVEQETRAMLPSARGEERSTGRWMLVIALRNQGRLREAAALLRGERLGGRTPPALDEVDYASEAQVALESGDPGRAASLFETRRHLDHPRAPGLYARWTAWHITLMATALAAAGDTLTVRRLADTVQYWGEQSLFGRDRKAHHFLRGLVLAAAGRHDSAVAEYRAAVHSWTLGYTRINYELARCLLASGRPAEAVPVLQAALRGEVDAGNFYLTRTELHELLGEAFTRAGLPDSAAAHDRAVLRAWAHADPRFTARREAVQRRLARAAR